MPEPPGPPGLISSEPIRSCCVLRADPDQRDVEGLAVARGCSSPAARRPWRSRTCMPGRRRPTTRSATSGQGRPARRGARPGRPLGGAGAAVADDVRMRGCGRLRRGRRAAASATASAGEQARPSARGDGCASRSDAPSHAPSLRRAPTPVNGTVADASAARSAPRPG